MAVSATTAGRLGAAATPRPQRSALVDQVRRRGALSQCVAHALGAVDVFLLLFFVLPSPVTGSGLALMPNVVAFAIVAPLGLWGGVSFGRRLGRRRMGWLLEGREPDPDERAQVLRLPNAGFKVDAGIWLVAAVIFGVVNASGSAALGLHVAWTLVLGGLTTCAVGYLLFERDLRPVTDLALASGQPSRPSWPGVQGRIVLAWLLATGSPLLGLLGVGIDALSSDVSAERLAVAMLALAAIGLGIGLTVLVVAARTVTTPLGDVRRALARVQAGDLSTEVAVNDGSEVGLLQSGFNSMVAGLREREHVQELYARQVGADVARAALEQEPRLGGETRDVAVLFVDLIGSTALAATAPPERVVARLNAFFAIVVDVVDAHGGWVNKFEGDAALCVFGAPVDSEDAAGCALAAARALQRRLATELPQADAGIGVAAGPAVAGWIGARQRFEYTVVGDAVNVASRLSELAKSRPGRVLASETIVRRAGTAGEWALGETLSLRGRSAPVRLAVPRG